MERGWAWLIEKLHEQPGLPILALLAFAGWAYWRSQKRARESERAGLCTRCGLAPATAELQDFNSRIHVCENCASVTKRSHTAAYYMFGVMAAILVAVFGAFVFAAVSGRTQVDARFLIQFGVTVVGGVVIVLQIRKTRRQR